MSLTRRIGSGVISQLLGRIVSTVITFYIVILLTRYLGLAGYGQYTTIIAYLNFFAVIADFGLYLIAAREMSQATRSQQKKIFNNSLGFRIASAFLLMLLAAGIGFLMPYDGVVKIGIAVFSIGMFFYLLNQVVNTIFQVYLKAHWIAVAEVAGRALVLLGIYYVIDRHLGLSAIMWVSSGGFILTLVLSIFFGHSYLKIQPSFNWPIWKQLARESWPVGAVIILTTLFFRSDAVILSLIPLKHVILEGAKGLTNFEAVGIYGPPYRILDALFLLPGIFLGIIFPQFTKYAVLDLEKSKKILQGTFDVLVLTAVPIAFGLLSTAFTIIYVMAGSDFSKSIVVMQILGFSLGLFFIKNTFYYTMIGIKKQKYLILPYFSGFIFSLVVNLFMISLFSYIGAAITSVATQIFILTAGFILVKKHLGFSPSLRYVPKIILSGAIMATATYLLQARLFAMFTAGALGSKVLILITLLIVASVVYLVCLYILDAIPKEIMAGLKTRKS